MHWSRIICRLSRSGGEQRMINLALDVHVRSSFLKAQDTSGQLLAHGRAGNSLLELGQMRAPVERTAREDEQPMRVVMEAATNSRAVAHLLAHLHAAGRALYDEGESAQRWAEK